MDSTQLVNFWRAQRLGISKRYLMCVFFLAPNMTDRHAATALLLMITYLYRFSEHFNRVIWSWQNCIEQADKDTWDSSLNIPGYLTVDILQSLLAAFHETELSSLYLIAHSTAVHALVPISAFGTCEKVLAIWVLWIALSSMVSVIFSLHTLNASRTYTAHEAVYWDYIYCQAFQ